MTDQTTHRGRHDRLESHFGDLPATLVELSSAIGALSAGATLEEALQAMHDLLTAREDRGYVSHIGTLLGNAYAGMTTELADDVADSHVVLSSLVGVTPVVFSTDVSAFTSDGPTELEAWTSDATVSYSGWVKLVIDDGPVALRIHTFDSGMDDTVLALFGPSDAKPGAASSPFHLADDNADTGFRSSIHDIGNLGGTEYGVGSVYSDDIHESGITLENGTYWVVVLPYDGASWDTAEGDAAITFQRVLSFTGDAWVVA